MVILYSLKPIKATVRGASRIEIRMRSKTTCRAPSSCDKDLRREPSGWLFVAWKGGYTIVRPAAKSEASKTLRRYEPCRFLRSGRGPGVEAQRSAELVELDVAWLEACHY